MRSHPRRAALAALLISGGLGACRADSIVTPAQSTGTICAADPCAPAQLVPAPDAPIVVEPLEDAVARIVPSMMDARARTDLPVVLNALRRALVAGHVGTARVHLARAYDAVDLAGSRLGGSGDAAVVLDLADLSAIRLALVPASGALGVAVP